LRGATNAILRYDRPDFVPDVCLIDEAGRWLRRTFYPLISSSTVCPYDAIREYMVDDTSPGYPWHLIYRTKKDFLDGEHGAFVDEYWSRLGTSSPVVSFAASSVKVEIRSHEKVLSDEPRTIIAMDACHTVSTQRLCLDQNNKLIDNFYRSPIVLGIDPFRGGWDRLCRRMSRHPNAYELDGKKFDGRFYNAAFDQICRFRFECLRREFRSPENELRFRNLYDSIKSGYLVHVNGVVYWRPTGGPSGH